MGLAAVNAHPNAVQARGTEACYGVGQTAVGVEVDGAPVADPAHRADGFSDNVGLKQWFPFASLAEANHRSGSSFEVGNGNANDLLDLGNEADAILSCRDHPFLLEADAAKAAGIADR